MSGLRKESIMEKRTQMENILEERNNKLAQLFWLSRLNELKSGYSVESLREELNEFLQKNDLAKRPPFDASSLPAYKPQEPPVDKRLLRSKSNTPLENGTMHRKKDDLPFDESRKRLREHKIPEENLKPSQSHEPIRKQQKQANGSDEQLMQTDNNTVSDQLADGNMESTKKEPCSVSSEKEASLTTAKSQDNPKVPNPMIQSSYYQHIGITNLHVEPTEVEMKRKQNFIIESITRQQTQPTENLFESININSKDSAFLVMKETIPAKIPQAVPLAELKYVSQTLPLIRLIPSTHKVLTTDLYNTALNEGRVTVVSSRIEELRRLNLWSLRQPKKFVDSWNKLQASTHHSIMLEEAKWMREDFHESKKFKIAICITLSQAIMDYWTYGKVCCVKTKEVKYLPAAQKDENGKQLYLNDNNAKENSTNDVESVVAKEDQQFMDGLPSIDVHLLLEKADPTAEIKLPVLPEVPVEEYKTKASNPFFKIYVSTSDMSSLEKAIMQDCPLYSGLDDEKILKENEQVPFVPVSKSTVLLDDDKFLKLVEKQLIDDEPSLVALSKRRGMFYGNRRSHYLKPPAAPALRYLKFRTPTIWSPDDDQELVKNINQYAYNWDLIGAQMLSQNTRSYISNIERRTPWQCFERFVQLNEKFSVHDMKGPRAHAAQIWLYEAHKLQQQQKRRISPLGVGSESIQRGHRRLRWASMFEAMRKTIKKRENAPRPNPSQPRKPLDVKSMIVPTPAEMSELKAQRDETLRREGQMRRAAKQRIQLAQLQQQQQQQQSQQKSPPPSLQPQQTPQPSQQQNQLLHGKLKARSRLSSSAPSTKEASNKLLIASRQTQSSPVNGESPHITTQTPQQRQTKPPSEKDIIESYARKIIAQKPEFTPELALKAAESYFRNVTLKQQQQQQQAFTKQIVSQSSSVAATATSSSNGAINKFRSPTPQEILQRIQQKKNDS
ncbi:Eaf1p Ecym_5517 [Eremothecium cymbalariae DBVPG|uniref:Chromatin modification-related protein EAF1 n=1 Tax=Eremothecium cymbalariae (strain CBS 270.75 / DBVPG 7215 / KCTC 17166 / NRRL Y-17582) TaxID=931890 RepID=I6NDW7_ERECY|nr:hypothetical protein Ecym_5517 [Eremothecium cymbalariae DBVPG\